MKNVNLLTVSTWEILARTARTPAKTLFQKEKAGERQSVGTEARKRYQPIRKDAFPLKLTASGTGIYNSCVAMDAVGRQGFSTRTASPKKNDCRVHAVRALSSTRRPSSGRGTSSPRTV